MRDSESMALSGFNRSCLVRQGFVDLDDHVLARLTPPLRFTPAVCLTLTALGTVTASAWLLGVLATMAGRCGPRVAAPARSVPGARRAARVRWPRTPGDAAPRRFAFVMATPELGAAAVSFATGAAALGVMQMAGCALYVSTGSCAGSFVHEPLFGPVAAPVARAA